MLELQDKSILLVEDEMIIGMNTKNQLEILGYNIIHVCDGNDAIQKIYSEQSIALVLMDIDLGVGANGIEVYRKILKIKNIPVIFVSSHLEPEIISLTERITSYGYIAKSSIIKIYDVQIKLAYKLFLEKQKVDNFSKYLITALENASEPIFISDTEGKVIYFNKAYLEIQHDPNDTISNKVIEEYKVIIIVFSENGDKLESDDWASTRPLKGESGKDIVMYVYNNINKMLIGNYYSYAPIYDDQKQIIGSYVKIGKLIQPINKKLLDKMHKEIHLTIAST